MRILVTNDDGINAPGLKVLEAIAAAIAGPGGEVWTVAPAFEQSGVSKSTSHARPTMLAQLGPRRFANEGAPADCVLAGVHVVMKDTPPDLVLSGVNRGNNSGENAPYSGTLGAAMEASLQGLPAIALSQYLGPRVIKRDNPFEAAETFGIGVVRALLDNGIWDTGDYRLFYNVNFPPLPADEVKGVRAGAQGFRQVGAHRVEASTSPNGRNFLWINSTPQSKGSAPGTDAALNLEGYVSVTPMRADFTAHDVLAPLSEALSR